MTSTISATPAQESTSLLIGATSQLGRMVRAFWPAQAPLVATARTRGTEFPQLDLMVSTTHAQPLMQGKRAVICMAGVTPARAAQGVDGFSRNSDLALATVRAAHAAGAGRVFLTSSAAVYSGTNGPLTEDAALAPTAPYGQAKAEMERAAIALAQDLGQPLTILRIGNVAGADAILGGWRAGMMLDQLDDGSTPARSYIGPQTLGHALHALTQCVDLPPVLNLSAPGSVQMGALLDAAGLAWAPRPAPDQVIADVTLCTKRLEHHIPFAPESGTPTGLVAEWRAYLARTT